MFIKIVARGLNRDSINEISIMTENRVPSTVKYTDPNVIRGMKTVPGRSSGLIRAVPNSLTI